MNRPSYVPYDNAGPSHAYDQQGLQTVRTRTTTQGLQTVRSRRRGGTSAGASLRRASIAPPAIPLNQSFGAPSSPGSASYNSEEPDELDAPLKSGDFPDLRAAWPGGLGAP